MNPHGAAARRRGANALAEWVPGTRRRSAGSRHSGRSLNRGKIRVRAMRQELREENFTSLRDAKNLSDSRNASTRGAW